MEFWKLDQQKKAFDAEREEHERTIRKNSQKLIEQESQLRQVQKELDQLEQQVESRRELIAREEARINGLRKSLEEERRLIDNERRELTDLGYRLRAKSEEVLNKIRKKKNIRKE